jgi:hypothetical protein
MNGLRDLANFPKRASENRKNWLTLDAKFGALPDGIFQLLKTEMKEELLDFNLN